MVLKQGERAEIRNFVNRMEAPRTRAFTLAATQQRIQVSNVLDTKADVTVTDALDTRLGTAEADIVGLDTRLGTAEADIVGLDGRVDTAETNIISQAIVDVDHETRIATIETALPDKLEWTTVPASASATGTAGQVAYESGWLYVCVAADTWERVAIATWV